MKLKMALVAGVRLRAGGVRGKVVWKGRKQKIVSGKNGIELN